MSKDRETVGLFMAKSLSKVLSNNKGKPSCFGVELSRSQYYYMEESVLLGTNPLVDSIRHYIRDPSGVFSVCHLCECRIVQ